MNHRLCTPKRRLVLTATSVLMAYGASAGAETTITLGGDLGFSAVVGLSKDGEAFDYATFASINLDIEKSTNSGLILAAK